MVRAGLYYHWQALHSKTSLLLLQASPIFIQNIHYHAWDWLRKLLGFWHNFAKWQSSKKEHFVGERHIFSFVGFVHVNLQNG